MDDPPPPRRWAARRGSLALGAVGAVGVVAILAGVAFLLGTRSREAEPGAGTATPASGRHVYLLQPSAGAQSRVSLEVAADEAARERGLSKRRELPAGAGMAFLFPGDTEIAFWMKDTLVPLQIAFVRGDGRVVGLFEMPPCRADRCPTYAPGRPYRYAVELSSGAFTAAGIREGDRVVPQDPATLPDPS
jgi:uncharacterized membrane protein (UPF0127 family)